MVIFPNVFTFLLQEELQLSLGDETLQPCSSSRTWGEPIPSSPLLRKLGMLVCRFQLNSQPPFSQAIYSLKTAN